MFAILIMSNKMGMWIGAKELPHVLIHIRYSKRLDILELLGRLIRVQQRSDGEVQADLYCYPYYCCRTILLLSLVIIISVNRICHIVFGFVGPRQGTNVHHSTFLTLSTHSWVSATCNN